PGTANDGHRPKDRVEIAVPNVERVVSSITVDGRADLCVIEVEDFIGAYSVKCDVRFVREVNRSKRRAAAINLGRWEPTDRGPADHVDLVSIERSVLRKVRYTDCIKNLPHPEVKDSRGVVERDFSRIRAGR